MSFASKPLGGIAALTLGVASSDGAAPTTENGGVAIPLLEDRSTYTEQVQWVGAFKSVTHTITLYTSSEYSLPEDLDDGLTEGFMALLSFNSGTQITVGWSDLAASDRALRLVSCSMSSGEKPSERGYKEWVLESIDAATMI